MGADHMWVQPVGCNPLRQEPSVLARRHMVLLPAAGCEQEFSGFLGGRPDVVIHRLAGLFRQFKSYGSPILSLAHGCPVGTIAVRSNVLDLDSDDIAASQFAVDGQIEHRQIARSLLYLELGPDRPDVFLP